MFGYLLSDFYSSTSSTHLNINIKNKDILHAISAAVGSALSITLLYPLETIRTRLQVDESLTPHSSFLLIFNIGRGEGVAGLYKGWYSLVVALMSLNFVYFYCFHVLRRWLAVHLESLNQVMFDLIVGYLAGCCAVLVTGPLWLVNTRLKLQGVNIGKAVENKGSKKTATNKQQYTGIVNCLYKISLEEGVATLWNGTLTSIILSCNPAINLGVYMWLKRHNLIMNVDENSSSGSSVESFVNALLSKFVATIVTYPIQVLQTRHRAGTANTIPRHSFMRGMYRGLESKLIQTCLNSAIMFVAYERLVDILSTLTDNTK